MDIPGVSHSMASVAAPTNISIFYAFETPFFSIRHHNFIAPLSTSFDKDVAEKFKRGKGVLFEFDKAVKGSIYGKKSEHYGATCCDVSWISKFGYEGEVLFCRGASFEWEARRLESELYKVSLAPRRIVGGILSTFCLLASQENETVTEDEIIECVKSYVKYVYGSTTEESLLSSFYGWKSLSEACDIAQLIIALKKRKINFEDVMNRQEE